MVFQNVAVSVLQEMPLRWTSVWKVMQHRSIIFSQSTRLHAGELAHRLAVIVPAREQG